MKVYLIYKDISFFLESKSYLLGVNLKLQHKLPWPFSIDVEFNELLLFSHKPQEFFLLLMPTYNLDMHRL